jgi:transcriptional repressor NrdR
MEGEAIRRRRECLACGKRYTTYEQIEEAQLTVVKKDGRREAFDRQKLLSGLRKACEKRPVSLEELEAVADQVERELQNRGSREVPSPAIGEQVMRHLRSIDEVAYVRFASVYLQFKDLDAFNEVLKLLQRQDSR